MRIWQSSMYLVIREFVSLRQRKQSEQFRSSYNWLRSDSGERFIFVINRWHQVIFHNWQTNWEKCVLHHEEEEFHRRISGHVVHESTLFDENPSHWSICYNCPPDIETRSACDDDSRHIRGTSTLFRWSSNSVVSECIGLHFVKTEAISTVHLGLW